IWNERDRYGLKGYHFSWSHDTMDVSTACDLVERCFLTFDTPRWVPDPGFNFVSLFLLQNRGMSFEQIDIFLRCFNSVVREKVLQPARQEPSPHLIETRRSACQFARRAVPAREALEVFSADRYAAAERFWLAEFAGSPLPAGGTRRLPGSPDSNEDWRPGPWLPLGRPLLETLERGWGAERTSVLLAALAAALLRLGGRDDTAVVTAVDDREPFPVRLAATERLVFRDLAQAARRKLAAAAPHRLFAPRILSGVFRMPGYLKAHPVFDVGYLEAATSSLASDDGLQRFAVPVYRELELILRVEAREDGGALQLLSCRDAWAPERMKELGEVLLEILGAAAVDPEVPLGDVPLAVLERPAKLFGRPLGALQFNF